MVDGVDRLFAFVQFAATDGTAAIGITPAGHHLLFAFLSLIVKGDEQAGSPAGLAGGFGRAGQALGIFAALAEFERDLKVERGLAGMAAARARGRKGGRHYKLTAAKLRMAMAAMAQRETNVSELCRELGITRQTLYRHVAPDGSLRPDGQKLLDGGSGQAACDRARKHPCQIP